MNKSVLFIICTTSLARCAQIHGAKGNKILYNIVNYFK